jgi:uncharacterized protein YeaO (DUF488 family)
MNPSLPNGKSDLLDRVLFDLTPDRRARVLDLTLRLGIDRDDPLWLISIAVGQLQILMEDAPNDWQHLFRSFEEELQQWTSSNLQLLENIARKAENEEILAQTAQQLTNTLLGLTTSLSELITCLHSSPNEQNNWFNALKTFQTEFTTSLEELREELSNAQNQQHSTLKKLLAKLQNSTIDFSPWLWTALACQMLIIAGLGFGLLQITHTNTRVQWLWQHQLKTECKLGVLPRSSSECQSL